MVGRKPEFDRSYALDAAMQVFWKKGYVGASLADLTLAMGINRPSLYSAFGNKEALFVLSLSQYLEKYAKGRVELLTAEGVPFRERVFNYLYATVKGQAGEGTPRGCYLASGLSETAGEGLPAAAIDALKAADAESVRQLESLFRTDLQSRELGLDERAEDCALYLITLLHGTASVLRSGRELSELQSTLEFGLRGLGLEKA
ncbi:TetR/AcrR family transcriptional regulator [Microbulbifer sp. OS29]|uniref:TetR/AcrR family transcriptional regulator n=1 Tax=Microbulbifer okhotskensis TaxID=2926617 RepID=A0A9X2J5C9_9GAMM|nr:TetR/AcrR family transcriptional regulator [Microbulbifer okhotskensis]MCO1335412.1 TetR/AcrR family transcriptional regulator [Microbulbifer okhotskensis]